MSTTADINIRGPGFTTLLAILFIGLKLTGYITWSWWWVLSPLWIPIVLAFAIGLIAVPFYFLYQFLIKR